MGFHIPKICHLLKGFIKHKLLISEEWACDHMQKRQMKEETFRKRNCNIPQLSTWTQSFTSLVYSTTDFFSSKRSFEM